MAERSQLGERPRAIVHVDLDAFFAAVEVLEDETGELTGRPIAVGGRPQERGVVTTASYEARKFGVHSAMPMHEALRLCPDLIIVPPHFDLYRHYSRQVMALLHEVTPQVEQTSVDEAYLDLSAEIEAWDEAVGRARELQQRIRRETRLSASLGVATNKLVAKVASDRDKPGGLTVVRPGAEAAFLAPLPVRVLWGVGAATARRLDEMGVTTVGDLAEAKEGDLRARFGRNGLAMLRHAQGKDNRPVVTERETKSVSQERTFVHDKWRRDDLKRQLWRMSKGVARRLQRADLEAGTIGIKMRFPDFTSLTRQMSLMVPTANEEDIYRTALLLLERTWQPGTPLRLLGVVASGLVPPTGQLPLWEQE